VILNFLSSINFKILLQVYIKNNLIFSIIYNIVNEFGDKVDNKFMIKVDDKIDNKMGDNIKHKKEDDSVDKVVFVLENNAGGLTITDIVDKINLSRSVVRIALANLEGGDRVSIRKVGMAKVYLINGGIE